MKKSIIRINDKNNNIIEKYVKILNNLLKLQQKSGILFRFKKFRYLCSKITTQQSIVKP